MGNKKNLFIALFLILVVFLALAFSQQFNLKCKTPFLKSLFKCQEGNQNQQASGDEKQEAKIDEPKVTSPKILYNLAGSIKNIEKSAIMLEAMIPVQNNGQATQKIENRKVTTSETTKFSRLSFIEVSGSNTKAPKETGISFKELKVGDFVEAVSNQDISNKEEFEAVLIRILPKNF